MDTFLSSSDDSGQNSPQASSSPPFWAIAVTATVVVIALRIHLFLYGQRDNKSAEKADLPKPSEIVSLRIYPIKSCRGIEIKSCKVLKTGLELDRNWMFVDADSKEFLTIRSDPSMTLIDTTLSSDGNKDSQDWTTLTIAVHGTDARISIPCHPSGEWLTQNCTLQDVSIWGDQTDGWKYSDEINNIFTQFFNKDVWLIYKGPTPRLANGNADESLYGKKEAHFFADVMSLQVASQASMDDLNRRLKGKGQDGDLTVERFRPNIIIKGNEPWEEDRWKRVQIVTAENENANSDEEKKSGTPLDVLARCARCQVPNVNPDTAAKHKHEPWDTLMKFRRVDTGGVAKYKPCFGMLCMPVQEGWVSVGSELQVLETTEKHLYNTARFAEL
ncbi:hypothetical protein AAFC00_000897 [Neodothiora populina]